MEVKRGIGSRIRVKRQGLDMSQGELGELLGVDQSYISLLELGQRHPPQLLILAMAYELGGSKDYWFKGVVR
jgi:transcriptional regulator with XRE-family HTH domain